MPPFAAKVPFDPIHPKALAIYCSDGRFTNAVEELLAAAGHSRLDVLTIPGGPGLFNLYSTGFVEREAARNAANFLIEGHKIQEVFLIAHQGCGWYQSKMPHQEPGKIGAAQAHDLRVASELLLERYPSLAIRRYLAQVKAERVIFHEVPATATPS